MAFQGLPETSKIFASIVHHLRTTNVNVNVSKIYPTGLIFGGGGEREGLEGGAYRGGGAYIRDNWVTYLAGVYSGGILTGFYGI